MAGLPLPQPRAAASAALITAFLGIFVILATRADDRGAGRAFAAGFLATLFAVPTMFVAWLGGGAVAGLFTGFIAAYMGAQIPFVRRKPPRGESEEHGDSRWADEIPAPRAA